MEQMGTVTRMGFGITCMLYACVRAEYSGKHFAVCVKRWPLVWAEHDRVSHCQ